MLDFSNTGPHRVYLELGAYLPLGTAQHVNLRANGRAVGAIDFIKQGQRKYPVDLPAGLSNPIILCLNIDHPMRPFDYEKSKDTRKLGISIYSISTD